MADPDIPDNELYLSYGDVIIDPTESEEDGSPPPTPEPTRPIGQCTPTQDASPVASTAEYSPCTYATVKELPEWETLFNESVMQDGVFTTYAIETFYINDMHTLQMPVQSTEVKSASFAVVANQTMKRIVRWSAEKWDAKPEIPNPNLGDDNQVLLETHIQPLNVSVAGDSATAIWQISGVYVYGIVDPSIQKMYHCVPAPVELTFDDTEVGNFQDGIINSLGGA